jgi:WD40 repeat protein
MDATTVASPYGRYLAGRDLIGTPEQKDSQRDALALMAQVNLLDTTTGSIREIPAGKGPIVFMRFSSDESRLAVAHNTPRTDVKPPRAASTIEVLNLETNRSEVTIPLPDVYSVLREAFSPDNRTLALVTARNNYSGKGPPWFVSVQVFDLRQGKEIATLHADAANHPQRSIWFTKDGKRLVVQCPDPAKPSSIWDWQAGKKVDEPIPDAPAVRSQRADDQIGIRVEVSHDGRYEMRSVTGGVEVIDRTVKAPQIVPRRRLADVEAAPAPEEGKR